jgi:hypothetical protein
MQLGVISVVKLPQESNDHEKKGQIYFCERNEL